MLGLNSNMQPPVSSTNLPGASPPMCLIVERSLKSGMSASVRSASSAAAAAALPVKTKCVKDNNSEKHTSCQTAAGQETLLRDLLIQPFTDEAVKLMGQRRPIKLSPSEQAAALSQSTAATTAWAVAELTRLQVCH